MLAHRRGKKLMNVRAINSHFIQNAGGRESILQASDKFETFVWISNDIRSGRRLTERQSRCGWMLMRTMSIRQQGQVEIENYVPGPAAIPEPFSNAVFRQMADEKITEA